MNNKRLTVWIGEREALPVRAIPYVIPWRLFSPGVVVESLAWGDVREYAKFPTLTAYHFPGNAPVPVKRHEWDAVEVHIKGFEAELQRQHGDDEKGDNIGYAAWRSNSVSKLPAGAFVYLDEFEKAYAERNRFWSKGNRDDNAEMTLTPMLDDDTRAMIMEGFIPRQATITGHIASDVATIAQAKARGGWPKPSVPSVGGWKISEFRSLYSALKGWYCRPLADLPMDLRIWVSEWHPPLIFRGWAMQKAFTPNYDSLTPAERISCAKQWDLQHGPEYEKENDYWFNLTCELDGVKHQIAQLEMMAAREPLQLESKNRQLNELQKQRGDIERLFSGTQAEGGQDDSQAAEPLVHLTDKQTPGKIPRVAIGKLAVEAAWELEQENNRCASAGEVMERLQLWLKDEFKRDVLIESKHSTSVTWLTSRYEKKIYDKEACGKTLKNWNKSRP